MNLKQASKGRCRLPILLGFCILSFVSSTLPVNAQLRGGSVTKHDLASDGFLLILPQDPSYDAELQRLGFAQSATTTAVRPFSAILKNTSSRSVVAFAVKWLFTDLTGNELSRGFSFVQPSALLDNGRAKREKAGIEHQIRPANSRLVTANGMARNQSELEEVAAHDFEGTIESVTLDLAIFDDGETVGPNELGLMDQFRTFVDAEQDVMQEVSVRREKGESIGHILADIRGRLGPDPDGIPTSLIALYDHNVRVHLKELEATLRNAGEVAAHNVVSSRKYVTRPNIHRGLNQPGAEVK